jgi:shikimate kinase
LPRLFLTGFMATGKSVVGPRAAHALGYAVVDLDRDIEHRAGKPIPQIFADGGEAPFRDLEAAALLAASRRDDCVIITGGGCVIRQGNRDLMAQSGHVVCLWATPQAIVRRTRRGRTGRPLLDGTHNPLERVTALLAEREAFYRKCHHIVDTTGRTVEAVTAEVVRLHREGAWKR